MSDLTIDVSSPNLTAFGYPNDGTKSWRGVTILSREVKDWLSKNTPTATHKSFYICAAITFTSETDLILFKLTFSDDLWPMD